MTKGRHVQECIWRLKASPQTPGPSQDRQTNPQRCQQEVQKEDVNWLGQKLDRVRYQLAQN